MINVYEEEKDLLEQDSKSGRGYDVKRDVWEWVESIAISVTTLIFIFVFVFRIVGVDGHSMDQTLADGDRLIITSMFYTPAAGDIVVVNQPNEFGKPLIKRIIALEGQTVDIDFKTGVVTVDGWCWTNLISQRRQRFMKEWIFRSRYRREQCLSWGITGKIPLTVAAKWLALLIPGTYSAKRFFASSRLIPLVCCPDKEQLGLCCGTLDGLSGKMA